MKNEIVLRPFEEDDLETYRSWINDPETADLLGRALPVTSMEHQAWYRDLVNSATAVVFSVQTTDRQLYLGNVWLWDIDFRNSKAEVRILIGEHAERHKGYGSAALEALSTFAFNKMNLHRLYAHILDINTRATTAFARAGFSPEGYLKDDRYVNGRYCTTILMARLRNG